MAALAVGASACGASSSGPATTRPDSIVIRNFAFDPASLTVRVGTTVTVRNEDPSTHTVTADDGRFNTGTISPGQTVTFRVGSTGTFHYQCAIHQYMQGTLTVTN